MKRLTAALLAILLVAAALPVLAADSLVVTEELTLAIPGENMYKVAGIITNQGKKTMDVSFANVDVKDKAGKTLLSSGNMVIPNHLEPGETAYYSVPFMDVSPKDLSAVASHITTTEYEDFGTYVAVPTAVITPLDQIVEEEGITAEFSNNTGKEIQRVRVVWILRDESGKLIDLMCFTSNFPSPIADGAKGESRYSFGWMTPSLAECLEQGLEQGSAQCLVFARQD